jgi:post-segregation antitoxin (ccd killing protein)
MTKKLTISIPEELWSELEPWRDRMNVSAVCARAIQEEIKLLKNLWREGEYGRERS